MKRNYRNDNLKNSRVILFINPSKKNALKLGLEIESELNSQKIRTEIFYVKKNVVPELKGKYDLAISLGGDGTVLSTARFMSPLGVPVFSVNLGTFGFIAGVQPDEWQDVFKFWASGKTFISERLMLDIKVMRKGEEIHMGSCLNEAVISSSGIAKIINLNVFLLEGDKKEFFHLGSYRSDGLIIASPTGSTAHSLAAGGPILDPELKAIILNPICPFALPSRPMVLPAEETIIVEVEKEQKGEITLALDGQIRGKINKSDKIIINKAPYYCLLAASGRTGFYDTLATKFAWAGGRKN